MHSLTTLPDVELLDLLSLGDRKAFSEIYKRYWKKLFTVAANKTADPEEAKEIVQDIFISLWQRRDAINITTTLSAYLTVSAKYRVLRVLALRHHHKKYADHSLHSSTEISNCTLEWLEFEELKSRLEVLVGNLPEKCRLVYKLSREEGLSHKQIAQEYGISEKTVEAHIGKALKSLRTGLGQIFL